MIRLPLAQRLVAVLILPALLGLVAGCGSEGGGAATGPCSYADSGSDPAKPVKAPPSTPEKEQPTELTLSTSAGDIPITFDTEDAPCTVNSFISLAKQGYFDGTTCHRLTTGASAVLQCGDPTGTGTGGPGYIVDDELVPDDPRIDPCGQSGGVRYCTYQPGLVAMANNGPDSNGSQFFLVYGASPFAPSYTVFGHFDAAGLQVLKKIGKAGVAPVGGRTQTDGAPAEPVRITSVS